MQEVIVAIIGIVVAFIIIRKIYRIATGADNGCDCGCGCGDHCHCHCHDHNHDEHEEHHHND